jgi:hypothetical protein
MSDRYVDVDSVVSQKRCRFMHKWHPTQLSSAQLQSEPCRQAGRHTNVPIAKRYLLKLPMPGRLLLPAAAPSSSDGQQLDIVGPATTAATAAAATATAAVAATVVGRYGSPCGPSSSSPPPSVVRLPALSIASSSASRCCLRTASSMSSRVNVPCSHTRTQPFISLGEFSLHVVCPEPALANDIIFQT